MMQNKLQYTFRINHAILDLVVFKLTLKINLIKIYFADFTLIRTILIDPYVLKFFRIQKDRFKILFGS